MDPFPLCVAFGPSAVEWDRDATEERWSVKTALSAAARLAAAARARYEGLPPGRRAAVAVGSAAAVLAVLAGAASAIGRGSSGPRAAGLARHADLGRGGGEAVPEPGAPAGSRGALGIFSFETPEATAARLSEETIRRLERDIRSTHVAAATVIYTPGPSGRSRLAGSRGDSAAVKLSLAPGVLSLSRQEAEAIRALVSCALKVDPERIALVDHHGRLYAPSAGEPSLESAEDEEYWRQEVRSEVNRYYARLFDASEFHVSVAAYVSRERVEIQKEEYHPEPSVPEVRIDDVERVEEGGDSVASAGGLGPSRPEGGPRWTRVKSKTEERFRATKATIRRQLPRGDLQAVGVNVLVDADAVLRASLGRDSRDAARPDGSRAFGSPSPEEQALVSAWSSAQEEDLKNLLRPYRQVSVRVIATPFARTAPAGVPIELAKEAGALAPAEERASWPELVVVGGILLAAGALAYRFLRPASGRRFLRALRARRARAWAGERGAPWLPRGERSFERAAREAGAAGWAATGLLSSVEEASARVRLKPEAASAVLRFWLSQDAGTEEGASRT